MGTRRLSTRMWEFSIRRKGLRLFRKGSTGRVTNRYVFPLLRLTTHFRYPFLLRYLGHPLPSLYRGKLQFYKRYRYSQGFFIRFRFLPLLRMCVVKGNVCRNNVNGTTRHRGVGASGVFRCARVGEPRTGNSPVFSSAFDVQALILSVHVFLPSISSHIHFMGPCP